MKPTTPKRRVPTVSSLVLCKGELFYQKADGVTIKTEYPVSEQTARDRARKLAVELFVE